MVRTCIRWERQWFHNPQAHCPQSSLMSGPHWARFPSIISSWGTAQWVLPSCPVYCAWTYYCWTLLQFQIRILVFLLMSERPWTKVFLRHSCAAQPQPFLLSALCQCPELSASVGNSAPREENFSATMNDIDSHLNLNGLGPFQFSTHL